MQKLLFALLLISFTVQGQQNYQLSDFYTYDPAIEARIDSIVENLDDQTLVGQLIMPAAGKYGKSDAHIEELVKKRLIGGLLLLNGEKEEFHQMTRRLDSLSLAHGGLPFLYSADAEPSLIKYKIKNSTTVTKAIDHQSKGQVKETAQTICKDLHYMGINFNFAPVIDVSDKNEAIGNRSFGDNRDTVISWSNCFAQTTQSENIVATVKHFPGHGQVKGDSHHQLVYVDGELKEAPNYQSLIDSGVIAIMVGHIAVKNNDKYGTDGLPSTCSEKIVNGLLRDEMGFKGIVVTDAMGMKGVSSVPQSGLKAISAGCDILLMPVHEKQDIDDILNAIKNNPELRAQVMQSVRKILRLKIVLGVI